ncbi:FtsB family cell division protein [Flavobacterium pallidum]|uniref:Septum formation initiator n=1 Tax=Flavobacterium pallidum TaxID=2172098 RepID=A0A2S1SHH5_9FLAO|nr:septum formation initiator family protein [Flavobacterium pallidum]AWI25863.1 septum formation initiator [Flavobacterium pallidum]
MKNPLKNTFEKWPLLRIVSNRYVLVLLVFVVWMLFLDNYSWLNHRLLDKDIDELNDNKHYYQEEIKKDVRNIKILKDSNQIEKFAREKYYMKRDSEDIYIIEFEGDTVKRDF